MIRHIPRATSQTLSRSKNSALERPSHICRIGNYMQSPWTRKLNGAVKVCAKLLGLPEGFEIQFGGNERMGTDVFFDTGRNALEISPIWFDWHLIHQAFPCKERAVRTATGPDTLFRCDHVVEELLRAFLVQIFRLVPVQWNSENRVVRIIREMLRHMPYNINVFPSEAGGLTVFWDNNANELSRTSSRSQAVYRAILHKEGCPDVKADPIYADTGELARQSVCVTH